MYVGAPERIDWGERLDPKGFVVLRPDGTWTFEELPVRPMLKIDVAVDLGDDVTDRILAALPHDVTGALVRIEVRLPDDLRGGLDEARLGERLRAAFHYEIKLVSTDRPRIAAEAFTMDPNHLLADYVDKEFAAHPRREAIKAEALRTLREVLS